MGAAYRDAEKRLTLCVWVTVPTDDAARLKHMNDWMMYEGLLSYDNGWPSAYDLECMEFDYHDDPKWWMGV